MEGRISSLLLSCIYFCLALASITAHAEELEIEQVAKPVVEPNIERMEFDESKIDPDNFEIIFSFGTLNIEDFGTNSVLGAKMAYRVSESFFVDLELGTSSGGETSIELLLPGNPILSEEERDFNYYLINVGYDLHSESFLTDNTTFNSAFYVIAGAGNTEFAGSDNFTFSYGFGYRILTTNFLSLYLDVRDHNFELDLFGKAKNTSNKEISFGIGFYF